MLMSLIFMCFIGVILSVMTKFTSLEETLLLLKYLVLLFVHAIVPLFWIYKNEKLRETAKNWLNV